jgi:hypothetical protein
VTSGAHTDFVTFILTSLGLIEPTELFVMASEDPKMSQPEFQEVICDLNNFSDD